MRFTQTTATFVARAACAALFTQSLSAQSTGAAGAAAPTPGWTVPVDAALGRHGTMNPGSVYKFSFPRSDMHVAVDGVALRPALALGSWVAFKSITGGRTMVMGDLVLGEDEVEPVMKALQAGGVEQTALHNHVLRESPRVMYMHIMAMGDATRIAQTIRTALGASATPLTMPASPAQVPAQVPAAVIDLDSAAVARALGYTGKTNGGVYQVAVPRPETVRESGETVPPAMGTAIALNFQPTGAGKAAITGDFVLVAREVNPVIRALRSHGIEVTAVHNHMLMEEPRLFFMHFWANDNAVTLAQGLRAALNETSVRQARSH